MNCMLTRKKRFLYNSYVDDFIDYHFCGCSDVVTSESEMNTNLQQLCMKNFNNHLM